MIGLRKPWNDPEQIPLSCLAYAEYLATSHGATAEDWPVVTKIAPDVEIEVQLPPEELTDLLAILDAHTKSYLEEANLAVA